MCWPSRCVTAGVTRGQIVGQIAAVDHPCRSLPVSNVTALSSGVDDASSMGAAHHTLSPLPATPCLAFAGHGRPADAPVVKHAHRGSAQGVPGGADSRAHPRHAGCVAASVCPSQSTAESTASCAVDGCPFSTTNQRYQKSKMHFFGVLPPTFLSACLQARASPPWPLRSRPVLTWWTVPLTP